MKFLRWAVLAAALALFGAPAGATENYTAVPSGGIIKEVPQVDLANGLPYDDVNDQLGIGLSSTSQFVYGCGNSVRLLLNPDYTRTYFPQSMETCATLVSNGTAAGLLGLGRTLGQSGSGIGIIGYGFADNTTATNSAWAYYGEGHRIAANQGAYGFEIAVVNRNNVACSVNPYNASCAGATGGQIDCGDSYPTSYFTYYSCTIGLAFVTNAGSGQSVAGFEHGVFFANNSINPEAHVTSWAVSLPSNYALTWWDGATTPAWEVFANDTGGIQLTKGLSPMLEAQTATPASGFTGIAIVYNNGTTTQVGVIGIGGANSCGSARCLVVAN